MGMGRSSSMRAPSPLSTAQASRARAGEAESMARVRLSFRSPDATERDGHVDEPDARGECVGDAIEAELLGRRDVDGLLLGERVDLCADRPRLDAGGAERRRDIAGRAAEKITLRVRSGLI